MVQEKLAAARPRGVQNQNSRSLPSRHFLVTSSKKSSLDRSKPDECAVVGAATTFLGLPFFFRPGALLSASPSTLLRKSHYSVSDSIHLAFWVQGIYKVRSQDSTGIGFVHRMLVKVRHWNSCYLLLIATSFQLPGTCGCSWTRIFQQNLLFLT